MNSKFKIVVGSVLGVLASAAYATVAFAQTVVTWDASDTNAIVGPATTSFKTNVEWALIVIIPFSIAFGLAWFVVHWLRGKARSGGR